MARNFLIFKKVETVGERKVDLFLIEPGKRRGEFNKTPPGRLSNEATAEVLFGQGIFILQHQNKKGLIDDIRVERPLAGEKIILPKLYVFSIFNIEEGLLVVALWLKRGTRINFPKIAKKRGMVYRLKEKEGKIEFVPNPDYLLRLDS